MKYFGTKEECVKGILFALFIIVGGLSQLACELMERFFQVTHFVIDKRKVAVPGISIALFFLYMPVAQTGAWPALSALGYVLVTWMFFYFLYVVLGVVNMFVNLAGNDPHF